MLLPIGHSAFRTFVDIPLPWRILSTFVSSTDKPMVVIIIIPQQPTGKTFQLLPRRACPIMLSTRGVEHILRYAHLHLISHLGCLASTRDLRCCADDLNG